MDIIRPQDTLQLSSLPKNPNFVIQVQTTIVSENTFLNGLTLLTDTIIVRAGVTLSIRQTHIQCKTIVIEHGATVNIGTEPDAIADETQAISLIQSKIQSLIQTKSLEIKSKSKVCLYGVSIFAKQIRKLGDFRANYCTIFAPMVTKWTGNTEFQYVVFGLQSGLMNLDQKHAKISQTSFVPISATKPTSLRIFGVNEFTQSRFYFPNGIITVQPLYNNHTVSTFTGCQFMLQQLQIRNHNVNMQGVVANLKELHLMNARVNVTGGSQLTSEKRFVSKDSSLHFLQSVENTSQSYQWGEVSYQQSMAKMDIEHLFVDGKLSIDRSQQIVEQFISAGDLSLNNTDIQAPEFTTLSGNTAIKETMITAKETKLNGNVSIQNAALHTQLATLSGQISIDKQLPEELTNNQQPPKQLASSEKTEKKEGSWLGRLAFWRSNKKDNRMSATTEVADESNEHQPSMIVVGEYLTQTPSSRITGSSLSVFDQHELKKYQQSTQPSLKYTPGMSLDELLSSFPPITTSSAQYNCLYHSVLCGLFEYLLAHPSASDTHLNGTHSFITAFNNRHGTHYTSQELLNKIQKHTGRNKQIKRIFVEVLAPTLRGMTHTLSQDYANLGSIGSPTPGTFQESLANALLAKIFNINITLYNQQNPEQQPEVYTRLKVAQLQNNDVNSNTTTETRLEHATTIPNIITALNAAGDHFETCGWAGQTQYLLEPSNEHYGQSQDADLKFVQKFLNNPANPDTPQHKNASIVLKGKIDVDAMTIIAGHLSIDGARIRAKNTLSVVLNGAYQAFGSHITSDTFTISSKTIVSFGNKISAQTYGTMSLFSLSSDLITAVRQQHSSGLSLSTDLSLPNTIKGLGNTVGNSLLMGSVTAGAILLPIVGIALGGAFALYGSSQIIIHTHKALTKMPQQRTFRDWIPVISGIKDCVVISVSLSLGLFRASKLGLANLTHVRSLKAISTFTKTNPLSMIGRTLSLVSARNDVSALSFNSGLMIGGLHQNFSLADIDMMASLTGYDADISLYNIDSSLSFSGDQLATHLVTATVTQSYTLGQYTIYAGQYKQISGNIIAKSTNVNIQHMTTHGNMTLESGQLNASSFNSDGYLSLKHIQGQIGAGQLGGNIDIQNSKLVANHLYDASHLHATGNNAFVVNHLQHTGHYSGDGISLQSSDAQLHGSADVANMAYDINNMSAYNAIDETGRFEHYHVRSHLELTTPENLDNLRLNDDRSYTIRASSVTLQEATANHVTLITEHNTTLKNRIECRSLHIRAHGNLYDKDASISTKQDAILVADGDIEKENGVIHSQGHVVLQGDNIHEKYDAKTAGKMDGTVYGKQGVDRIATHNIHQTGGVTVGNHVGYYAGDDILLDTQVTYDHGKPKPHAPAIISGTGGTQIVAHHNIKAVAATFVSEGRNDFYASGYIHLNSESKKYLSSSYHSKHKHEEHYRTQIQTNTLAAKDGNYIHAGGTLTSSGTEFNSATGSHISAQKTEFTDAIGTNIDQKEHHNKVDHSKAREVSQYAVKNAFTGGGSNSITSEQGIFGNTFDLNGEMLVSTPEQNCHLTESRLINDVTESSHGFTNGMHFDHHDIKYQSQDPYKFANRVRKEVINQTHDVKHDNMSMSETDNVSSRRVGKRAGIGYTSSKTHVTTNTGSFAKWNSAYMAFDAKSVDIAGVTGNIGELHMATKSFTLRGVEETTMTDSVQSSLTFTTLATNPRDIEADINYQHYQSREHNYQSSELHVGSTYFKDSAKVAIIGSTFQTQHISAKDIDLSLEAKSHTIKSTTTDVGVSTHFCTNDPSADQQTLNFKFGKEHTKNLDAIPAIFDCQDSLAPDNFTLKSFHNKASILHSHGTLDIQPESSSMESIQEYHHTKAYSISVGVSQDAVSLGGSYARENSSDTFNPTIYGDQGTHVRNIDPSTFVSGPDSQTNFKHHSSQFTLPSISIWERATPIEHRLPPIDTAPHDPSTLPLELPESSGIVYDVPDNPVPQTDPESLIIPPLNTDPLYCTPDQPVSQIDPELIFGPPLNTDPLYCTPDQPVTRTDPKSIFRPPLNTDPLYCTPDQPVSRTDPKSIFGPPLNTDPLHYTPDRPIPQTDPKSIFGPPLNTDPLHYAPDRPIPQTDPKSIFGPPLNTDPLYCTQDQPVSQTDLEWMLGHPLSTGPLHCTPDPSVPVEGSVCIADPISDIGLFSHQADRQNHGPGLWYDLYRDGSIQGLDYAFSAAEDSRFLGAFKKGIAYPLYVIGEGHTDQPFLRGAEAMASDALVESSCVAMTPGGPLAVFGCSAAITGIDLGYPLVHEYQQHLQQNEQADWDLALKLTDPKHRTSFAGPGFPVPSPAVSYWMNRYIVDGVDHVLGLVANRHETTHEIVNTVTR